MLKKPGRSFVFTTTLIVLETTAAPANLSTPANLTLSTTSAGMWITETCVMYVITVVGYIIVLSLEYLKP